jgi:NADH-quinone oxidoreductase subunit N
MTSAYQQFVNIVIPILPEIAVILTALLVLIADLFLKKEHTATLGWFSLFGLGIAAVVTYSLMGTEGSYFSGAFLLDPFSIYFKFIFYSACGLGILLSINYLKVEDIRRGEYYALLLFATSGMMFMAAAGDFITLYLGLELMALSLYILAGFMRKDNRSNEAAIKYLVLGAFSSGIMLYGMSLLYGLSGSTNLADLMVFLQGTDQKNPIIFLGMIMLIVSFGFKVAAAPFHMWAPDVYEGSPTSVTAFMSAGPKVAGFAVLLRVFLYALEPLQAHSTAIIAALAFLTMAVGTITALSQTNIKRMLAYSSIAHAGYALIGLAAAGPEGAASVMLYVCIYAFMNMGAFGIVILLRKAGERGEEITDFAGLGKTNKTAAFFMLIFMFSLTGIPPFAGFMGKFYIFKAAIEAGLLWLAIAGVLFSAVSAYFYLRVVMVMYMNDSKGSIELATSPSLVLALAISAAAVIVLGVYPTSLLNFARASLAGVL